MSSHSDPKSHILSAGSGDVSSGLPDKGFTNPLIDTNPFRDQMPGELMKRTPFGVFGKPSAVSVNSHRVEQWPDKDVYQYDVSHRTIEHAARADPELTLLQIIIGSGQEKRGLVNAIWNSKIAKAKLDNSFIFDGKAIGWSVNFLNALPH